MGKCQSQPQLDAKGKGQLACVVDQVPLAKKDQI